MPKGVVLTPEEQENRRREIFDAAAHLFLQKGFQETSVREIAEAAGMGKSSLYDYFRTKDEILVFVLEEQTLDMTERAREIAARDLPPEVRLKQIMHMHFNFMQDNRHLHARLSAEVQRLKPESQKIIQERRYAYQNLVQSIIDEGIEQGRFRRVNSLNAARLLINSLISVMYTTRPTSSAEDMLDEAVLIFLEGIKS